MKREALSVMILEPNALQCNLIQAILTRHQMTPIICPQPVKLRQLLRDHLPDVLLVDTYLPEQNGLDLIDELQTEFLLQRTKVIFISSMGYPEIVQKAARLGVSGFLVKPLSPEILVNRIQQCFERSKEYSM